MTDERSTTMSNADDESTATSAQTLGSPETDDEDAASPTTLARWRHFALGVEELRGELTDARRRWPRELGTEAVTLVAFLEWLDVNREVTFADLDESHEETVLRYLKEEEEPT
jgi:hypothetical protein